MRLTCGNFVGGTAGELDGSRQRFFDQKGIRPRRVSIESWGRQTVLFDVVYKHSRNRGWRCCSSDHVPGDGRIAIDGRRRGRIGQGAEDHIAGGSESGRGRGRS